MNRLQNAWRPLLLGLVLLSVLVGVAGAMPTHQPSALGTPRQLVISAADFYPCDDSYDYSNYGDVIYLGGGTSLGYFVAPVDFPYPLWVTIDKLELFAYDNNSAGRIEAYLYLGSPASFGHQEIGYVETGVSYASPAYGTWQDTTISPNVKNPAHDVYLRVYINADTNLKLFGVRVFYYMGR